MSIADREPSCVRTRAEFIRLGAAIVVLAVAWVWALPAVGRIPSIRADMRRMDSAGIDASALYWTELDDARLWKREQWGAARRETRTDDGRSAELANGRHVLDR